MINQFIMDLKKERSMSPHAASSPGQHHIPHQYHGYLVHNQRHGMVPNFNPINPSQSLVLDLSKRRDSVETRKTPSPYNTSSSYGDGSPSTNSGSPSVPVVTTSLPKLASTKIPAEPPTFLAQPPPYPIYYPHVTKSEDIPSPSRISPNYCSPHERQFSQHQQLVQPIHSFGTVSKRSTAQKKTVTRQNDSADESGSDSSSINVTSNTSAPQESDVCNSYPKMMGRDGKLSRPFKAYPRDPLTIAATFTATDSLLDTQSAEKYNAFRKRMFEQIHAANGGHPTISNPKMRRTSSRNSNEPSTTNSNLNYSSGAEDSCADSISGKNSNQCNSNNNNNPSSTNQNSSVKDSAYYERRRKNNAAAKKSRDRRRIKEDEIAIRAAYLERENIELKIELAAARKQLTIRSVAASI